MNVPRMFVGAALVIAPTWVLSERRMQANLAVERPQGRFKPPSWSRHCAADDRIGGRLMV